MDLVAVTMKRSNAPFFWLLFGAGGMLSALTGTALVFVTGIAAPLGWGSSATAMTYARAFALAQHAAGKVTIFVLISLFAWHAAHRIYHSLHDLGLHAGRWAQLTCYGTALAVTLIVAASLTIIGA